MLSAKFVRENPKVCKENLEKKFLDPKVVDEFLKIDIEWKDLKSSVDSLRSERNKISENINKAKKEGKDAKEFIEKAKTIPQQIKTSEEKLEKLEKEMNSKLSKIPNIMHEDVPKGKDESENPTIKEWGDKKDFSFPIKNHVELCEELGIADFESSAKTSGNGFYFIEGGLALLNQALIQFGINFMTSKGYKYIETPLMIKEEVVSAAADKETLKDSIYYLKDEDLCLIGTSEHSILGRYTEKIFVEKNLPEKAFSYSMCFRREIGSHGINEKGLWRTHQFNKVEQFIFCNPENSYEYYEELLKNTEEIMQALKLPYRVIEICSGDLSPWKARSHDIEVWRPTTKDYGEVGSLSNCTDYQARDLNIRLDRKGQVEPLHTLNNTAIATSRIMVAILENYQNKDGSIDIPEVLIPFMPGKIKKISKN